VELGDGNFPPPYPPGPEEPIRIYCPQKIEWLRRAWLAATRMPNVDWNDDPAVCKLMIFVVTPYPCVRREIAEDMKKFYARDGRESLVYGWEPLFNQFRDWDHDIFRREPWRIVDAS
jgi:hypothetical protein